MIVPGRACKTPVKKELGVVLRGIALNLVRKVIKRGKIPF